MRPIEQRAGPIRERRHVIQPDDRLCSGVTEGPGYGPQTLSHDEIDTATGISQPTITRLKTTGPPIPEIKLILPNL